MHRNLLRVLVILAFTKGLFATQAHAYIDPGSGSFFVQMLLAGFIAAGVAIKSYWHKLKGLFGGSKPPVDEEDELG